MDTGSDSPRQIVHANFRNPSQRKTIKTDRVWMNNPYALHVDRTGFHRYMTLFQKRVLQSGAIEMDCSQPVKKDFKEECEWVNHPPIKTARLLFRLNHIH